MLPPRGKKKRFFHIFPVHVHTAVREWAAAGFCAGLLAPFLFSLLFPRRCARNKVRRRSGKTASRAVPLLSYVRMNNVQQALGPLSCATDSTRLDSANMLAALRAWSCALYAGGPTRRPPCVACPGPALYVRFSAVLTTTACMIVGKPRRRRCRRRRR